MQTRELNLHKKDLKKAVEERNVSKIKDIFDLIHIADISSIIITWDLKLIETLMDIVGPEQAGKILYTFDRPMVNKIIEYISVTEIYKIFDKLDIDEAVSLLFDANYNNKKKILANIPSKVKEELTKQSRFPTHTVGFHMHHEFIAVKDRWTISQAKKYIKTQIQTKDGEIAGDIFVTTSKNVLRGVIRIEDLFTKSDATKVNDLVKESPTIKASEKVELASDLIKKYDVPALPVVNDKGFVLGVLEAADIIDYIEDDVDLIAKPEAVSSKSKVFEKPYLELTTKEIYKSRIGWMMILLIVGTITQVAITGFQLLWAHYGLYGGGNSMASALTWGLVISIAFSTALSVVTSISGSGGNSGAQASTTLIRAFALGHINEKDMKRVYKKEITAVFYIALTIAFVSILRTYFVWTIYTIVFKVNAMQQLYLLLIAVVAAFSFFMCLMVGNLISIFLPLWAYKKGKDAAVISSPIQSTVVDVFSIIFYLGITSAIFIPLGIWINSLGLDSAAALLQCI